MPIYIVTFKPSHRAIDDHRWTAASQEVDAIDKNQAIELARDIWSSSSPGEFSEPHEVATVELIA